MDHLITYTCGLSWTGRAINPQGFFKRMSPFQKKNHEKIYKGAIYELQDLFIVRQKVTTAERQQTR